MRDEIVEKIQEYRMRLGLSQTDLAERMGVPQSTIARIERGETGVSSKTLFRFLSATGLDIEFINSEDSKLNNLKQYSVLDVAKYIIEQMKRIFNFEKKSNESYYDLTNMKLNKLIYYVQMYNLGMRGYPLFKENLESWDHGPVVRELYDSYKHFVANVINEPIDKTYEELDSQSKKIIDTVLEKLGYYSAYQLRAKSHKELPWKNAMKRTNKIISEDDMKKEYKLLNLLPF
ncbi:DUF4065 domain-containing protein [Candidatus Dojkabacteria bacterium]|nr:DUF4065 domain-containing protein [Candidatus Dojkabacteria bacterium]